MKLPHATVLTALGTVALLAGCTGAPGTDEDEFNRLAAQTENEIGAAEETGFLWRDTEPLLTEARKAQRDDRHGEAMTLAQKALRQAQLAQQQARDNANAGPNYPKGSPD